MSTELSPQQLVIAHCLDDIIAKVFINPEDANGMRNAVSSDNWLSIRVGEQVLNPSVVVTENVSTGTCYISTGLARILKAKEGDILSVFH